MCGIAGIVRFGTRAAPDDAARVAAMVSALRHRGPNDSGVVALERATLGHTRLSILDLSSAARQPMRGADVTLTYNGELFDFRRLREHVTATGARVASTGDTEVLLRLLELEWERAPARLRGMFAFAAFDQARNELLLVRDPLGKKPLFFTRERGDVVFASELSALKAADMRLTPNAEAVREFLVRGYVPAPRTICSAVEQVGPGEAVLFASDGRERRIAYAPLPWLDDPGPRRVSDVEEACVQLRERFVGAVQRRLVADVPVGAFLSGGFDSAAVVAAARSAIRHLKTFSIGYVGAPEFDETASAARSASLLGTDHQTRVLDLDALGALDELTARCGEPQGDSSAVPSLSVAAFASEEMKVVLTGDGGDELFAGYDRFLLAFASAVAPRRAGAMLSAMLSSISEGPRSATWLRRLRRLGRAVSLGPAATLMEWAGGARIEQIEALVGCVLDSEALAEPEARAIAGARARGAPTLHTLLTANFATYLPGDVLPKLDRASMAVGLEARSPFLDEDLVLYAAGLAPLLIARGVSLKWIAKRALAPLVPDEIASRRKKGFGAPVSQWFRRDAGTLREKLRSSNARLHDHVDRFALERILDAHSSARDEAGILLWRLLALEEWLRWAAEPVARARPAFVVPP